MRLFSEVWVRGKRQATRRGLAIVLGILFVVGVAGAMVLNGEPAGVDDLMRPRTKAEIDSAPGNQAPIQFQAVTLPPIQSADATDWSDEELVVGIAVNDEFRAYRLRTMQIPDRHVVNDIIGGESVSITYCNLFQCIRAFSGDRPDGPLDLKVAGLDNGKGMILGTGGDRYYQGTLEPVAPETSRDFPYSETDYTVTTWREWRAEHPETFTARLGPL
jgi:hypothetical protein